MRIHYMRELLAIKEQGNISRAARSLFMTQPALSRHVQDMERELGVKLLERDKHSVELTEMGERACKSFRKILRTYDSLADDIAGYKLGQTGRLRIGMLYYTIRQDFGDTMERFSEEYPNVDLRRYSYQPQEVFQALAEERIDIGVLPHADYPDADYLRYQDIVESGLAVLMSKRHPLAGRESLALDDLRDETSILLSDDPYSNLSYSEALGRCGFVQSRTVYTDNIDTVPMKLQRGRYIYFAPQGLTVPAYESDLVVVPIEEKGLTVRKAFAWRADNDSPLIPIFLEMAKR